MRANEGMMNEGVNKHCHCDCVFVDSYASGLLIVVLFMIEKMRETLYVMWHKHLSLTKGVVFSLLARAD